MPARTYTCMLCGRLPPCGCASPLSGLPPEFKYAASSADAPPPRILVSVPPRPCCFPFGSCILPSGHGGYCCETVDEVAEYQRQLRKEIRSRYRWERFFAWLFRQPKPKAPLENPSFFLEPLPEAVARNRARQQSQSPVVLDDADE